MKGVGQVKARSIVEWRDAREITMVPLVSKTNIRQATWAKWYAKRLIVIQGMAEEE